MKNFLFLYYQACRFLSYLWITVWGAICRFFLLGEAMQSGELEVTGRYKVEINLGSHPPCRVMVGFRKGHHHHVPCNPKHHDELRWELLNKHQHHRHDARHDHCHHEDKYILVIAWDIADVRTIEWVAYY